MKKENYQLLMEKEIDALANEGKVPKLLLHSCCAPCSSYVLECLSAFFDVTVYYYNPNIFPADEFYRRAEEQKRLVEEISLPRKVSTIIESYDEGEFLAAVKGLEGEPEGGDRCTECFRLRLGKTGEKAKELGFDYFTTTLSVSPHKNSHRLNAVGGETAEKCGVKYLYSDFKKKEGYKRSLELSAKYGLYRQAYCGCRFAAR